MVQPGPSPNLEQPASSPGDAIYHEEVRPGQGPLRVQWLRMGSVSFFMLSLLCAALYGLQEAWVPTAVLCGLALALLLLSVWVTRWAKRLGFARGVLCSMLALPLGIQLLYGGLAHGGIAVLMTLIVPSLSAIVLHRREGVVWRWVYTLMLLGAAAAERYLLPDPHPAYIAALYAVLLVSGWMLSLGIRQIRLQVDLSYSRAQQLASQLQETQYDLGAADRVKSDFLASMSHEIRTPMHAISGMADMLLLSDQLGPTEYMQAENIKLASQSLLGLINDILDISKIEAGKLELYEERYDFPTLFHDVVSIISVRARERSLAFLTQVDPDIPKEMVGDSGRIRQVLLNLLGNAVKFTDCGSVTLSVQRVYLENQLMLRFDVRDTGVGISQEDMRRLFQVFEQLDSTRAYNRQGTGLGLAISRRLVELMHSELKVQSEVGRGSVFSFTIAQQAVNDTPIASVPNAREKRLLICSDQRAFYENAIEMAARLKVKAVRGLPTQASGFTHMLLDLSSEAAYAWIRQPTPPGCQRALLIDPATTLTAYIRMSDRVIFHPLHVMTLSAVFNDTLTERAPSPIHQARECLFQTRNVRVLLIDDNAVNLMVAANLLKLYGIQVDQAASGEQGISMLENNAYDIVFLDHIMPGMDGVDTVRAIRAKGGRFAKQVVLMLSANVMPESRKLFMRAGVQDMLAKPIELPKLSQLLSGYLPPEKCVATQSASSQQGFVHARVQQIGQALQPLGLPRTAQMLEGERIEDIDAYLLDLHSAMQALSPLAQVLHSAALRVSRHTQLLPTIEQARAVLLRIGERRLSARCKVFCRSLEEGDLDFVRENIRSLAKDLSDYYEALRVALQQCDLKNVRKSDEVQLLEQLHELLLHFEYAEAQEQLTVLRAVAVKVSREQLNVLHAHLQSFRYQEALELLDGMLMALEARNARAEDPLSGAQESENADLYAAISAMRAMGTAAPIANLEAELGLAPSQKGAEEDEEIAPEDAAAFDAEMEKMAAGDAAW